jgi:hypothetical protein
MSFSFGRCLKCKGALENLRASTCPICGNRTDHTIELRLLRKYFLFVAIGTPALAIGTSVGYDRLGWFAANWLEPILPPKELVVGLVVTLGAAISSILLAALHGSRSYFAQYVIAYFLLTLLVYLLVTSVGLPMVNSLLELR